MHSCVGLAGTRRTSCRHHRSSGVSPAAGKHISTVDWTLITQQQDQLGFGQSQLSSVSLIMLMNPAQPVETLPTGHAQDALTSEGQLGR